MSTSSLSRPARFCGVLLIALITCACAPRGNVEPAPAPQPDPRAVAGRLLAAGDFAAAAAAYDALAASATDAAADDYRGIAALARQDAGDYSGADTTLAGIDGSSPAVTLAKARSMLHAGLAGDAYAIVHQLDRAPLSPYERGVHARCLAAAALATGHNEEAAKAAIDAYHYPYPTVALPTLNDITWRSLTGIPAARLEALRQEADDIGAGWYELALVAARSLFDLPRFGSELEAWRARYAGHPASSFTETIAERAEALAVRPRRIALLLPFDDALQPAARAVRDGFLTAWYLDADVASRPEVRVYSTTTGTLAGVVDRALGDGADFIIGPLRKNLVDEIQRDSDRAVNVLALNVADQVAPARANIYQFGLTPESEAIQVARRAMVDGKRAIVLAPDTSWGQRLVDAYDTAWSELGGEILATVRFAERTDAYPTAVKRALNIDQSEARAATLRRRLGIPIHTSARRRADVDVILLAAFPDNARQVMPQLRYFGAGDVPVFATSHVYSGQPTAESDVDLDGIVFGDMPWLFERADPTSHAIVTHYWSGPSASYARLYALGIDAYRVLPYLARMRFQPATRVPGVTGELSMDAHGVLERQLTWLRFVDGQPRLLDGLPAVVPR